MTGIDNVPLRVVEKNFGYESEYSNIDLYVVLYNDAIPPGIDCYVPFSPSPDNLFSIQNYQDLVIKDANDRNSYLLDGKISILKGADIIKTVVEFLKTKPNSTFNGIQITVEPNPSFKQDDKKNSYFFNATVEILTEDPSKQVNYAVTQSFRKASKFILSKIVSQK